MVRSAVDLGGFDQVAGHTLQAGHIDDHHIADLLPAHQDDQAHEACLGVQSQQRPLEIGQHTIEQDLPDVAQQDAADQVGHEVDRAEQIRALNAAGQHEGDGERADVDEHSGQHRERCREAEGVEEGGILEDGKVVLDAHKGGLRHGGEPLEGQVDAPDEGPDEADDERDEGRQHEHRPIFADGLLHDIPPNPKKKEAGELLARLPYLSAVKNALWHQPFASLYSLAQPSTKAVTTAFQSPVPAA